MATTNQLPGPGLPGPGPSGPGKPAPGGSGPGTPRPGAERPRDPEPAAGPEIAAEQSLIPAPRAPDEYQSIALTPPQARLPVELDVAVPVRGFRVRALLTLSPGQVIETQWANGEDVPLRSGPVQLAWSEFEVVDTQLAVRVTRLT